VGYLYYTFTIECGVKFICSGPIGFFQQENSNLVDFFLVLASLPELFVTKFRDDDMLIFLRCMQLFRISRLISFLFSESSGNESRTQSFKNGADCFNDERVEPLDSFGVEAERLRLDAQYHDQLEFRQAYTYSKFHYDKDEETGDAGSSIWQSVCGAKRTTMVELTSMKSASSEEDCDHERRFGRSELNLTSSGIPVIHDSDKITAKAVFTEINDLSQSHALIAGDKMAFGTSKASRAKPNRLNVRVVTAGQDESSITSKSWNIDSRRDNVVVYSMSKTFNPGSMNEVSAVNDLSVGIRSGEILGRVLRFTFLNV
jgi:hypothetical protein